MIAFLPYPVSLQRIGKSPFPTRYYLLRGSTLSFFPMKIA
jgi:hypothetical protein